MSGEDPDRQHGSDSGGDADFARLAEERSPGLIGEYLGFLRHTGKWWLLPIFIMLGLIGGLVILGGTGVAPFLYALF